MSAKSTRAAYGDAKQFAAAILPDPWKRATGQTIQRAIVRLRRHGVPDDVTRDVLDDVVSAMRDEYGE